MDVFGVVFRLSRFLFSSMSNIRRLILNLALSALASSTPLLVVIPPVRN